MRLVLTVLLLAALIAFTGCVSKDAYEDLEADYQNLRSERSDLKAQYEGLVTSRDALQAEQSDLQTRFPTLEKDLGAVQETLHQTTTAKAQIEATATTLEKEFGAVQETLHQTTTAKAQIEAIATALEGKLASVTTEKDNLQESYDTLKKGAGDVEALQQQQIDLNRSLAKLTEDIKDLEQQRQAIVPAVRNGQLVCTGSMDPTLTCLDTMTWLANPFPDEIVVGAVISFDPPDDCNLKDLDEDINVAHRVIDIQAVNRERQYRTKGDNNRGDDGCWVPFSRVDSLLTGVTKGSNAEMQALLEQIWPLEDTNDAVYHDMDALSAEIAVLEAEYEAANAAYYEQYSLYCSGTLLGQTCILPPDVYNVVKPLLDRSIQLYNEVSADVDAYNDLQADYTARRAAIRTMRNQMEVLRCTKLYTCTPHAIP